MSFKNYVNEMNEDNNVDQKEMVNKVQAVTPDVNKFIDDYIKYIQKLKKAYNDPESYIIKQDKSIVDKLEKERIAGKAVVDTMLETIYYAIRGDHNNFEKCAKDIKVYVYNGRHLGSPW